MSTLATTRQVNVLDPDFYVDPWDDYRWLRDEAPVYWDPAQKLWAISRYDAATTRARSSPGNAWSPSRAIMFH